MQDMALLIKNLMKQELLSYRLQEDDTDLEDKDEDDDDESEDDEDFE